MMQASMTPEERRDADQRGWEGKQASILNARATAHHWHDSVRRLEVVTEAARPARAG